jgi:Holliday junction DNA helicase RuvA
MIGFLEGVLHRRGVQGIILEVSGVGYEVELPLSALALLPADGARILLHTHHMVREDAQILYGFLHLRERDLFRRLLRVNGIGARLALTMLSSFPADRLVHSIQQGEIAALTRIPGIGKRTAERIVLELSERLGDLGFDGLLQGAGAGGAVAGSVAGDPVAEREASAALAALGYRTADIDRMLAPLRQQGYSTETLLRLALRGTLPPL